MPSLRLPFQSKIDQFKFPTIPSLRFGSATEYDPYFDQNEGQWHCKIKGKNHGCEAFDEFHRKGQHIECRHILHRINDRLIAKGLLQDLLAQRRRAKDTMTQGEARELTKNSPEGQLLRYLFEGYFSDHAGEEITIDDVHEYLGPAIADNNPMMGSITSWLARDGIIEPVKSSDGYQKFVKSTREARNGSAMRVWRYREA